MVRLPVEYQEVEYLESTGTQYIDTGYVPVVDTWVDAEYGFSDTYSGEQVMLGASSVNYTYNNTTGLTVQLYNRNKWYCGCGGSVFGGVLTGIGKELYIKHRVILTKSLLTVDGNEQRNPGRATFDPSQPCYLYAINAYGIGAQRLSKTLRLYSVKLYENENIMRDFIPCYRKSDSEPGMYDTVSGTFFTNQGTGTFIVGNDVSWEAIDLLALRRMVMLSMANAAKVKTGSFIGDGTNVIDLNLGFEPDIVFCYAPNLDLTEAGWMGQSCAIIIKNVAAVQIRHNNETTATALSTANPRIGGDNPPYGNTVDSYNPYGSYTNGVFRLTNTTNNGLTRFINNEHYEWVAIKYS